MTLGRGAAAVALLAALPALAGDTVADDFEGTLATTDTPPGLWAPSSYSPAVTFNIRPSAAHRGDGGYQLVEQHVEVDAGPGAIASLFYQPVPNVTGDYFFRGWFRLAQSNDAGTVFFAQLEDPTHRDLCEFAFNFDTTDPLQSLLVGGFTNDNFYVDPIGPLEDPHGWHLFECDLLDIGSGTATRQFFWDGVLRASRQEDLAGNTVGWVDIGEPYGAIAFAGEMNFDDVRTSRTRPATWLTVSTVPEATVGDCVNVDVSLADALQNPTPAPYDLSLSLATSGAPGAFYDEGCHASISTLALDAGMTSTRVGFRAREAGTARLSATHLDFLSADAGSVAVRWYPTPDRSVACGCDATPSALGALAMLAVAGRWRGRRNRSP